MFQTKACTANNDGQTKFAAVCGQNGLFSKASIKVCATNKEMWPRNEVATFTIGLREGTTRGRVETFNYPTLKFSQEENFIC